MNKKTYFDNVFISLKRAYSKDEFVADLLKKNTELGIELGKVKSTRDELIYNIQQSNKLTNKCRNKIKVREYYRLLVKEIKAHLLTIKKLKREKEDLLIKLAKKNLKDL